MNAPARSVTVIPATINPISHLPMALQRKRRVAGYARVSTDSEEQLTSYEAQVDYYTRYIQSKSDWEFVKVYTDEGITATNTKKRDGFNKMVEDALAGKIDLIVTKSVSRFARNTVDSLTTVRKLKEKGVEVFFEKENIYTLDSKGELLITIMSSLAQEESRSISENVTWGKRKQFADGKVSLPYKNFLGYRKGSDGLPEIVPAEAEVVRRIYTMFILGDTACSIAKKLTKEGIPTPSGRKNWSSSTIESILSNEKYKGDALLQKTYTLDFLTKKMVVNDGKVPQYYVENSHPAIIQPWEFSIVQAEIIRRKSLSRRYSGQSVLATHIICGDCGDYYGSKLWHSTSKYRRTIWQCNSKFTGEKKCLTPHLDEETVKAAFITAFNTLIDNRKELIEAGRLIQHTLTDCTELNREINATLEELDITTELIKKFIAKNASEALSQEEYAVKYSTLMERYDATNEKLSELSKEKQARDQQACIIGGFLFELMERDEHLTEFDPYIWAITLDVVTACHDGSLVFKFRNGLELTV